MRPLMHLGSLGARFVDICWGVNEWVRRKKKKEEGKRGRERWKEGERKERRKPKTEKEEGKKRDKQKKRERSKKKWEEETEKREKRKDRWKIDLEGYAGWEKLTMERKESLAIAASTN